MFSSLDKTPAVKHLLIINVLAFLALKVFAKYEAIDYIFPKFYIDSPYFKFWQPITSSFMHYDLMHLAVNMFIFTHFGMMVEEKIKTKRFLILCLAAVIGGSLFTNLYFGGILKFKFDTFFPISAGIEAASAFGGFSSIGFSAVSTAILAAFALIYPNRKLYFFFLPIGIPSFILVGLYLIEDLYLGTRNILSIAGIINVPIDNIGHFAHLGGAVFGVLLLMYWQKNRTHFY